MKKLAAWITVMYIFALLTACSNSASAPVETPKESAPTIDAPISEPSEPPTEESVSPTPIPITIPNTFPLRSVSEFTQRHEGMWILDTNLVQGTVMVHDDNKVIYSFSINFEQLFGYTSDERNTLSLYGETAFDNGDIETYGLCSPHAGQYGYALSLNIYSTEETDMLTISRLTITTPKSEYTENTFTGKTVLQNESMIHIPNDVISQYSTSDLYDKSEGVRIEYNDWSSPSYLYKEESNVIITDVSQKIDSIHYPSDIELKNITINKDFMRATLINPEYQYGSEVFIYLRPYIGGELYDPIISYRIDILQGVSTHIELPMIVLNESILNDKIDGYVIGLVSLDSGVYTFFAGTHY